MSPQPIAGYSSPVLVVIVLLESAQCNGTYRVFDYVQLDCIVNPFVFISETGTSYNSVAISDRVSIPTEADNMF